MYNLLTYFLTSIQVFTVNCRHLFLEHNVGLDKLLRSVSGRKKMQLIENFSGHYHHHHHHQ